MADSAIIGFASGIVAAAQDLVKEMQAQGVPEPSFDENAVTTLWTLQSGVIDAHRQRIMDMTAGLHSLVSGPYAALRQLSGTHFSSAALRAVLEFDVLKHIPLGSSVAIDVLAEKTGLDEDKLRRMLRLMNTHAITAEAPATAFKHTAFSRRLAEEPEIRAQILMQLDEMNKASAHTTEYLRAKPRCNVSHESPFSFQHGKSLYEWYEDHPTEAARFARAQAGIEKMSRGIGTISEWFLSSQLRAGTKVVDVGAGNANLVVTLAEQHPQLHFVAQDLYPKFFEAAKNKLKPELVPRVSFEQHDFFKPQPKNKEVGVYLLRSCLHNWSDSDARRILQAFEETLAQNPAARLLLNEKILPNNGEVSLSQEQDLRRGDMGMLVIANAKQRSEEDWRNLVQCPDSDLRILRILGSKDEMCVIEIAHSAS